MQNRTAVFIDNGYFNHVRESYFKRGAGPARAKAPQRPPPVDYLRFSDALVSRVGDPPGEPALEPAPWRLRSYVYDSSFGGDKEKSFLERLERLARFTIRLGGLEAREDGSGHRQLGVDVALAVDLVRLAAARQVEFVVLVSGDTDFVPAVEAARDAGAVVWLFHGGPPYGPQSAGYELIRAVDEAVLITPALLEACRLHPAAGKPGPSRA